MSGADASSGPTDQTQHATCVAVRGRGVLIVGASGSGKSGLALTLMAFGAELVSDDRVILHRQGARIIASAPASIAAMIEARGIGILNAAPHSPVPVHVVVDLDQTETSRLPEPRKTLLLGHPVPLLHAVNSPYFPAMLLQYVQAGRRGFV